MVTEQESESSRGQQSHTLLLSVLSAVFVAFLFLSASLHLTFFFYSLSSSQTLLRLPFSIWVFSIYFRLHFLFFLSSVWHTLTFRCLLDCLSGSLFLLIFSLLSCLTLSRPYSVTFVWRNKVTVWEMEFLAFSSKGFDKKDGHCCHDCWLNMEQQLEVRKKHSLA